MPLSTLWDSTSEEDDGGSELELERLRRKGRTAKALRCLAEARGKRKQQKIDASRHAESEQGCTWASLLQSDFFTARLFNPGGLAAEQDRKNMQVEG